MAIKPWIAGIVGLFGMALAPASAQALTASAYETVGGVPSIIGVARDQVTDSSSPDVATTFPGEPGTADLLPSVEGTVFFSFVNDNYFGAVTGTTSLEGQLFRSELFVTVTAIGTGPRPILQIFQTAPGFSTTNPGVVFDTEITQLTFGSDDSIVAAASWFSGNNVGGTGDNSVDLTTDGLSSPDDFIMQSSILCNDPSTSSSPACQTNALSGSTFVPTIADQDFAINHALAFVLADGDTATIRIVTVAQIPLPAPMLLLLSGLAAVGAVGARKRFL